MKPGNSRTAKSQINYNNYLKSEQKKFHIKNVENDQRKKKDEKLLEIQKLVASQREGPKPIQQSNELLESDDEDEL